MKIGIAGAGAGKTTAMADTIIQFRSEIEDHKKIFCITFEGNPLVAMYWRIDSIAWLAGTMIFTEYRCQTLHLMYAVTRIVRIWQNRE